MKVKALVITGYGINCEKEMAHACQLTGAHASIVHAKSLLTDQVKLDDTHLLLLPGGFSFGDELGAAKAFANRLNQLRERFQEFVAQGKCILGICNGFQVLVKLGLLPGSPSQVVSLTYNDSCRFESRWAHHKVCPTPCIFTKDIEQIYLPIRHAEGKFVMSHVSLPQQQIVLRYTTAEGKIAKRYPDNPNGSQDAIAGICDPTGRIFGMMAHPEAALYFTNHPQWTRSKEKPLPKYGDGLKIFQNAINYIKESL